MNKITLRYQKLSDAKRFFEILNNPHFIYFSSKPKTVEEEKKFLRLAKKKVKKNIEHNFTILLNNVVVGGIGVKINQTRPWIGEIGYFLDEKLKWSVLSRQ